MHYKLIYENKTLVVSDGIQTIFIKYVGASVSDILYEILYIGISSYIRNNDDMIICIYYNKTQETIINHISAFAVNNIQKFILTELSEKQKRDS